MTKLEAQPWSRRLVDIARQLGVNPLALAATAEIESGFGATTKHQSRYSSALGMFQMQKLAYLDALKEIARHDPDLYRGMIKESVRGRNDPENEAVAAMGYLVHLVEELKRRGVSRPTFLDVRAAYNFGLDAGVRMSQKDKTTKMKDVVGNDSVLKSNGISKEQTVDEWRRGVIGKVGYGAATSVVY